MLSLLSEEELLILEFIDALRLPRFCIFQSAILSVLGRLSFAQEPSKGRFSPAQAPLGERSLSEAKAEL